MGDSAQGLLREQIVVLSECPPEHPLLLAQRSTSTTRLCEIPVEGPKLVKHASSDGGSQKITDLPPIDGLVAVLIRSVSRDPQVAVNHEDSSNSSSVAVRQEEVVAESDEMELPLQTVETVVTTVITHRAESTFSRQFMNLCMGELTLLLSFCARRELCRMSQVCSHLRFASSSDVLWRPVVAKALMAGTYEHMCDMYPELAVNIPKIGLKAAFNKYKTPPLVPADKLVWEDGLVLVFTSLNTADFVTDILVLISFVQQDQMTFFWISIPFLLLYPVLLLLLERSHGQSLGFAGWMVNIPITFLQIRIFVEAAKYYDARWRRYKLSGAVLGRVTRQVHDIETHTKDRSANVTVIKSFEAAFESVPQSLLQTFIVVGLGQLNSAVAIFSIFISLVSVSLGFASLAKPRYDSKHTPFLYFCVSVYMFTGLAFRLVAFSMIIVALGIYGIIALAAAFALNLILDCTLQAVKCQYIVWMPVFAFVTTLVPITFYPHEANWTVFNLGLFTVNWGIAVVLTAVSLALSTSQEFWLGKLLLQIVCALLQWVSFYILLVNKVQVLNRDR